MNEEKLISEMGNVNQKKSYLHLNIMEQDFRLSLYVYKNLFNNVAKNVVLRKDFKEK